MNIRIKGKKPLRGEIKAVSSKSDAHRAIICAAMCESDVYLHIDELNEDIEATLSCLQALGAKIQKDNTVFKISRGEKTKNSNLFCRESGSTLRFLLPVAAALGGTTSFDGSGKLPSRPLSPFKEEIESHGIKFSANNLPFEISGKMQAGRYCLPGNISSQYVSGLLMALPLVGGKSYVHLTSELQSSAYVDMTLNTLEKFGINWNYDGDTYSFEGGKYNYSGEYFVEGDWSGAAFYAVAGAIKGSLRIDNLNFGSLQPDKAILDIIKNAGACVKTVGKYADIKSDKVNPFELDVSQYPDLFPILAIFACAASGNSRLYNAGRLRIKESDRIKTTANMISALGGNVTEGEDFLVIHGKSLLKGGVVDGANDHRIVMSAAIASLICDGDVTILGSEAASKSYRTFFDDFIYLGGESVEV